MDVFFTDQNTGDVILTRSHSLHSVFNNCYGLALARTFQSADTLSKLAEEVHLHQNVRHEDLISIFINMSSGITIVSRSEIWTSHKDGKQTTLTRPAEHKVCQHCEKRNRHGAVPTERTRNHCCTIFSTVGTFDHQAGNK